MKCEICKNKIETTFLKKIIGTYIKDKKGKKHNICGNCQSNLKDKDKILEQL
ncbi:MAG: hypothetical protein ACMXX8_01445 [Candidatus Woesearchaeota archaeon]